LSESLSLSLSLARSLAQAKREIEARLVPLQQSVRDFEEASQAQCVRFHSLFSGFHRAQRLPLAGGSMQRLLMGSCSAFSATVCWFCG